MAVTNPLYTKEHEHEDHEQRKTTADSKAETVVDPHVWHDAQNGIKIVEIVADNLQKLAPSNQQVYTSNAEKMNRELTQLDTWIESQIATIPPNQRTLVTTHDALGYYVKAYNLSLEGALASFSTEEQPSAARVKEVVKIIKNTGVPTVFAETTTNPKLIETVAREANVRVSKRELFADSLGEPGTEADTYQKMLIANTRTIVEGLGGKYTSIQPLPSENR